LAHPPYPVWHWISEFLWLACYTSATVLSFKISKAGRRRYLFGLIFIIVSRIVLGSGGSFFIIIELPIVIYLIFFSFKNILKTV